MFLIFHFSFDMVSLSGQRAKKKKKRIIGEMRVGTVTLALAFGKLVLGFLLNVHMGFPQGKTNLCIQAPGCCVARFASVVTSKS